jgi:hypothetical protein
LLCCQRFWRAEQFTEQAFFLHEFKAASAREEIERTEKSEE